MIEDKCNFETGTCSLECKKYPMCAYMSIQRQFSELQKQIEFIYETINTIVGSELKIKKEIEKTNESLNNSICELLDLYNKDYSELNKESPSEKESK